MKSIVFLLLLGLPLFSFAQGGVADLDNKYGFRNIKLGTPLDSINNLVILSIKNNPYSIYRKTNENLKIGDIKLTDITYSFVDDSLYAILIELNDENDAGELLQMIQNKYGEGIKLNSFSDDYYWRGEKVIAKYHLDKIGNVSYFLIESISLSNKREEEEKNKNKQAAQSVF
ncbi:MAG: hypothetical protein EPN37_07040 [Chitinophagaceae bacterium]|nr:MAG: hypothetical protein EPN37_07040 [Chitinophagaceae bacterium]